MSVYIHNAGRFEDGEPVKVVRFDRQHPTERLFNVVVPIATFRVCAEKGPLTAQGVADICEDTRNQVLALENR